MLMASGLSVHYGFIDCGTDEGCAAERFSNGRKDLNARRAFQNVSRPAGPERFRYIDGIRMHAKENDLGPLISRTNAASGVDPVEVWHRNVDNDNVGHKS